MLSSTSMLLFFFSDSSRCVTISSSVSFLHQSCHFTSGTFPIRVNGNGEKKKSFKRLFIVRYFCISSSGRDFGWLFTYTKINGLQVTGYFTGIFIQTNTDAATEYGVLHVLPGQILHVLLHAEKCIKLMDNLFFFIFEASWNKKNHVAK